MTKRFSLSRTILTILMLAAAVIFCATKASADGAAYFNCPDGAQKGSSVTVTLTISCDSNIGVASANVSYDETILEFVSCDFAAGGGGELVIAGAFPDSASGTMQIPIVFNALDNGDAKISASGYVFDNAGTVIAEINTQNSVTVGGGETPPEPDVTTTPAETEPPETTTESVVILEPETTTTTQATAVAEPDDQPAVQDPEESSADLTADTSSKAAAGTDSSAASETERSDLAKKLTIPLLIVLAVLVLALVILTVWLKDRMKKRSGR